MVPRQKGRHMGSDSTDAILKEIEAAETKKRETIERFAAAEGKRPEISKHDQATISMRLRNRVGRGENDWSIASRFASQRK
jgi:hypothetical protein